MGGITVRNWNITHRRGDTGVVRLSLNLGGVPYTVQEGDTAVLTIKKRAKDSAIVLQKKMDENGEFVFLPEDTKDLPCGKYVYDVQVTLASGEVVTVSGVAKYNLLPDVTTEVIV